MFYVIHLHMSEKILMNNGVALWLARNTKLSLEQIADFCHLHPLQVQNFRVNILVEGVIESNPVDMSLLTLAEIKRCEENPSLKLETLSTGQKIRGNAKKEGVLDAVLWLIKKYSLLENSVIAKLLKCSSVVVRSVRSQSCKDYENIVPKNPVSLGLCTQKELDECVIKLHQNA